jgi:transposase
VPEVAVADRGCDEKAPAEAIEGRGGAAVIPTRKNRAEQREVDPHLHRERDARGRFRAQAKRFRRVATRYEKRAANYLPFAWVAALTAVRK